MVSWRFDSARPLHHSKDGIMETMFKLTYLDWSNQEVREWFPSLEEVEKTVEHLTAKFPDLRYKIELIDFPFTSIRDSSRWLNSEGEVVVGDTANKLAWLNIHAV